MATRDIEADYRNAYIAEYKSYKAAGRSERAEYVAGILRTAYDHEVEPKPKREKAVEQAAPERADLERPPEDTAEPKPKRPSRPRPSRDAEGNVIRDDKRE